MELVFTCSHLFLCHIRDGGCDSAAGCAWATRGRDSTTAAASAAAGDDRRRRTAGD